MRDGFLQTVTTQIIKNTTVATPTTTVVTIIRVYIALSLSEFSTATSVLWVVDVMCLVVELLAVVCVKEFTGCWVHSVLKYSATKG